MLQHSANNRGRSICSAFVKTGPKFNDLDGNHLNKYESLALYVLQEILDGTSEEILFKDWEAKVKKAAHENFLSSEDTSQTRDAVRKGIKRAIISLEEKNAIDIHDDIVRISDDAT